MNELFVQSATFQRLYNCSLYNVSEIPLAERQWPVQGSFFLAMGIVQEVSLSRDDRFLKFLNFFKFS
jgi:hypothetical protein